MQTSSGKSGVPLDIRLSPVRELLGLQLIVLVCGEVTVWFLLPELTLLYQLPLAVLMLLAAVHGIRKHALLAAPDSVLRITWRPGEGWRLYMRAGRVVTVRLSPDSRVFRWAVILCFNAHRIWFHRQRNYKMVLLPYSVDRASMRQLRVHLNAHDCSIDSDQRVSPF